jgi:hypothetical protein
MPERVRTRGLLAEKMRGTHLFYMGDSETITPEALTDATNTADDIYLSVIRVVDWSRTLLEAEIIHTNLGHGADNPYDRVCGACIERSLLATSWDEYDKPETIDTNEWRKEDDWPVAVARCVTYRRARAE